MIHVGSVGKNGSPSKFGAGCILKFREIGYDLYFERRLVT